MNNGAKGMMEEWNDGATGTAISSFANLITSFQYSGFPTMKGGTYEDIRTL
jgi:hypothetical protein